MSIVVRYTEWDRFLEDVDANKNGIQWGLVRVTLESEFIDGTLAIALVAGFVVDDRLFELHLPIGTVGITDLQSKPDREYVSRREAITGYCRDRGLRVRSGWFTQLAANGKFV